MFHCNTIHFSFAVFCYYCLCVWFLKFPLQHHFSFAMLVSIYNDSVILLSEMFLYTGIHCIQLNRIPWNTANVRAWWSYSADYGSKLLLSPTMIPQPSSPAHPPKPPFRMVSDEKSVLNRKIYLNMQLSIFFYALHTCPSINHRNPRSSLISQFFGFQVGM